MKSTHDPREHRDEQVVRGDEHRSAAVGYRRLERIHRPRPHHELALGIDVKSVPNARRAPLPERLAPQLATRVEHAPRGDGWLHEIKFDGYRILARIAGNDVRLFSRNGKDWTARLPALEKTLARLAIAEAVIDGEIVALQSDGTSSFRQLQEALAAKRTRGLVFEAFDLLHLDGHDLTSVELATRKKVLKNLLASRGVTGNRGTVRYVHHFEGKGTELFEEVCRLGLEGIVSKRRTARYRSGRNTDWLKVKCAQQGEFVVGGYTEPADARPGLGELLLGAYTEDRRLAFTGTVSNGFSGQQLRRLYQALRSAESDRSPFSEGEHPPALRDVHWVRPQVVVDVEFTEWSRDGIVRHPVFRGLREDREPEEVDLVTQRAPERADDRRGEPAAERHDETCGVQ
ncbi:MAG TPA: non-homologous end-joining DNA ligase [Gammaproteobacteria bacterium]